MLSDNQIYEAEQLMDSVRYRKEQREKAVKKNMAKLTYKRTGEVKELEGGLVSWIADGTFDGNDGEPVPCEIGYWMDDDGDLIPTHIFVHDCYSECGNHYESETIEL